MRLSRLAAACLAALAATAVADGPSDLLARRLSDLSAETLEVREQAARALERSDGLTEDRVRAELARAGTAATASLLRIAAVRGMKGLVPEMTAALASTEPLVSDAAARALVVLGDDAVKAGSDALAASKEPDAATARRHLSALAAQRAVERGVIAKWRRKGGTYEGRYRSLEKLGWPVQPVLLAMLLDVPLADRHVVLPETSDPAVLETAKLLAIIDIENSDRRGYLTFDPLPMSIETSELFDLAAQALKDVGDIDLLGDVLTSVSEELESVDDRSGFRLRPVERFLHRAIDEILFARGRPERLERLVVLQRREVERARGWNLGGAESLSYLSQELSELGDLLHRAKEFDASADAFAEVIRIGVRTGGKEPSVASYNRACALARAGRKEEAIRQLARSLDRNVSAGSEDLTAEWVTEDGDLDTLRDDPRYAAIIKKRFGEDVPPRKPPDAGASEPPK